MDQDQARQGLDAISDAQRAVARASAAPLGRHAGFAAVMAALTLSLALPQPYLIVLLAVALAGVVGLVQWDRRHTGMFVNGYRRGRTLLLTLVLAATTVALNLLTVWLGQDGRTWLALLPVPVTFAVAFGGSLWWERIFLREMGAAR